uniref:Secreted protein n=1 Tax=Tanacetum cinerariifolium TaxID=118510 RepID=A0A699VTC9_TANCI|nr:hypothetical protein [Tanacetum cinerariifolium]
MAMGAPGALLITTTAMAPAFWAFCTLSAKPQVPRYTTAMLPLMAAAFRYAPQPSSLRPPAAGGVVWVSTSWPVTGVGVSGRLKVPSMAG